jgi:PAS domain S-box-containing protein
MSAPQPASTAARPSRFLRPLSVAILVIMVGISVVACLAMRQVVAANQRQVLVERGRAASDLLSTNITEAMASMRVLGSVANDDPADARRVFKATKTTLLGQGATAVEVVALRDGRPTVLTAVGTGPTTGTTLSGSRAAFVERVSGLSAGGSTVMTIAGSTLLAVGIPVGRVVVYEESIISPHTPLPANVSPFDSLNGAMYASPRSDPSLLVLTTNAHLPITGSTFRATFPVGNDTWSILVSPRGSLVGRWTANLPWLVLGAGLALALLVAAMAEILSRRQRYARQLVADRTEDLETAMNELDRARSFLSQLVTAGPLVVLAIIEDLQTGYVSPNIETLFGITEESAMAPRFLDHHVDREHLASLRQLVNAVRDGTIDGAGTLEVRLRMGSGAYRWVSVVAVPAHVGEEPTYVLVYVLDVDDRRRAEHAQREAQQVADAANRSKSEFLSRMSHELRTPLNAILGYGQVLELEPLADSQVQPVAQILRGGRHLLELINEVLDISRIEAGELSLSLEPVPVGELIETAMDLIRPQAQQAGIELVVASAGLPGYILADRQRARQVLLNLLSNAVKYNRPGGSVAVSCEVRPERRVRINVRDTGPGIPADQLERAFAPFERLAAGSTDVEGTGIGLALSRRLSEALGGQLGVDSIVGQGSTFWLDLPQAEGPLERHERLGADGVTLPAVTDNQHGTVLLIEDNPANVQLIERVLEHAGNITLISAMYGGLGLELARHHHPDLVLLDLHLADISGLEVLRQLQADPDTASMPVVVVSADATSGQIERAIAAGATAYLTKPIDIQELLAVVDAMWVRT